MVVLEVWLAERHQEKRCQAGPVLIKLKKGEPGVIMAPMAVSMRTLPRTRTSILTSFWIILIAFPCASIYVGGGPTRDVVYCCNLVVHGKGNTQIQNHDECLALMVL